ncbi:PilZ domain-containing protein [Sphingomonas sp. MMS12-HWE2-04]|uniref:PilZ domain-containing protein n=1 Tax=Sphingomonas sp. MMS12-HWE2-04 TaxID=3234199 RepID=UPI00384B61C0
MYLVENPAAADADPSVLVERAPRIVTTLLVGKLIAKGHAEHLCRVRNISASGMMIDTYQPLGYGTWVAVELRSGDRLQGTVVWSSTGRAGVEFATDIDVDYILAEAKSPTVDINGNTPRAPRFVVQCQGRITSYGRHIDVIVENVSQTGAQIRMPRPPRKDSEVILTIPGLPQRRGTTRWSTEDTAGLAFHDLISYQELAAFLGHVEGVH